MRDRVIKLLYLTWYRRWVRYVLLSVVSIFLFILLLPLPSPLFSNQYVTVLEANDGTLLGAKIAEDGQWRFPVMDSVPKKFKTCLLYFEDEYFYHHPGINPISIVRALQQNIESGEVVSGGSTITMQLMRMARGNQPRTIRQKIIETLLAVKTELLYSKTDILTQYVSHAPFGGNVVGLEAASWRYFGRPPDQLSWAEAAALAVLPNSPSAIFPGRNDSTFLNKRNFLLEKLFQKSLIDESTYKLSLGESLPDKPLPLPEKAQHLLARSIEDNSKGKVFHSTIDPVLQNRVTDKVNAHAQVLKHNLIHNAAALVIEISSGKTLAYVGNVSSNDGDHGQYVDIINSQRSTGSILKPFLYASSLNEGLILPNTLLPDIPMFYHGFAPENFDKKFRGAVPANEALASSLNVPFVFLLRAYGYEKFHQKLRNVGMQSLTHPPNHYGLTLILGGAESSLWEITAIYASLARSLKLANELPPDMKKPHNNYHTNYYLTNNAPEKELTAGNMPDPLSIWYTFQAMRSLNRPQGETGWKRFSHTQKIAWKTGTSIGFRDAWAVGLNGKYVVGVWAGNADGEGRAGLTGVNAAAPLMFDIFSLLKDNYEFKKPYGKPTQVCTKSGYVASENCTDIMEMNLNESMAKSASCRYHKVLHLDKQAERQVNSSCYAVSEMKDTSWFILPAVQSWYYKQYNAKYQEPPSFAENCATDRGDELMELIYPRQFTKVYVPKELTGEEGLAIFEAAHRDPQASIFWHLDNEYIQTTNQIHQIGIHPEEGLHTISLIDNSGNMIQQRFEVISE